MNLRTLHCIIATVLVVTGCASGLPRPSVALAQAPAVTARASHSISALKLLGTAVVSRTADGVRKNFGGISGIDRDPKTNIWYLLSDDRSEVAPARFYTAAIDIDASGFRSIDILSAVALQQADGSPFPGPGKFAGDRSAGEVPDPESVRVDPVNGDIVWSSEGSRRLGLHPFVKRADRNGVFVAEIPIPDNLKHDVNHEIGSRNNLTIEGIAFSPDGSTLWASMEGPLYQDGPVSTLAAGSVARFTKLARDGKALAQYAYPVDPIPAAATGGKRRADNGVSEILVIDQDTLLVIERSGHEIDESLFRFSARIYEVKVGAATDVAGMHSLAGAAYVPMTKRLLLDTNTLGLSHVDCLEAATWGPRLPNGNATLVLASDDNFASNQVSQFIAFEVVTD